VAWSFRIWRGSIDRDLLAADIEADVFALTHLGAALSRSRTAPARSTAVSVLFTGSEASVRALDTAVKLATDPVTELNILLSAEDATGLTRLQQLAIKRLGDEVAGAHFIPLHESSLSDLLEILRDTRTAVLIIERDNALLQTATLRQNLNNLDCPLLVVR
ncbi:MAG: hypothetical protein WBO16_11600, partial [Gammaproteobacteria bacterium]